MAKPGKASTRQNTRSQRHDGSHCITTENPDVPFMTPNVDAMNSDGHDTDNGDNSLSWDSVKEFCVDGLNVLTEKFLFPRELEALVFISTSERVGCFEWRLATIVLWCTSIFFRNTIFVAKGLSPISIETLVVLVRHVLFDEDQLGWAMSLPETSGGCTEDSLSATGSYGVASLDSGGGVASRTRVRLSGWNIGGRSSRTLSSPATQYVSYYSRHAFAVEQLVYFVVAFVCLPIYSMQRLVVTCFFACSFNWAQFNLGHLLCMAMVAVAALLTYDFKPVYYFRESFFAFAGQDSLVQNLYSAYSLSYYITLVFAETNTFPFVRAKMVEYFMTLPQRVLSLPWASNALKSTLVLLQAAYGRSSFFGFYFFLSLELWYSVLMLEWTIDTSITSALCSLYLTPIILSESGSGRKRGVLKDFGVSILFYGVTTVVVTRLVPGESYDFFCRMIRTFVCVLYLASHTQRRPLRSIAPFVWLFFALVGIECFSWGYQSIDLQVARAGCKKRLVQDPSRRSLHPILYSLYYGVSSLVSRRNILDINTVVTAVMCLITTTGYTIMEEGLLKHIQRDFALPGLASLSFRRKEAAFVVEPVRHQPSAARKSQYSHKTTSVETQPLTGGESFRTLGTTREGFEQFTPELGSKSSDDSTLLMADATPNERLRFRAMEDVEVEGSTSSTTSSILNLTTSENMVRVQGPVVINADEEGAVINLLSNTSKLLGPEANCAPMPNSTASAMELEITPVPQLLKRELTPSTAPSSLLKIVTKESEEMAMAERNVAVKGGLTAAVELVSCTQVVGETITIDKELDSQTETPVVEEIKNPVENHAEVHQSTGTTSPQESVVTTPPRKVQGTPNQKGAPVEENLTVSPPKILTGVHQVTCPPTIKGAAAAVTASKKKKEVKGDGFIVVQDKMEKQKVRKEKKEREAQVQRERDAKVREAQLQRERESNERGEQPKKVTLSAFAPPVPPMGSEGEAVLLPSKLTITDASKLSMAVPKPKSCTLTAPTEDPITGVAASANLTSRHTAGERAELGIPVTRKVQPKAPASVVDRTNTLQVPLPRSAQSGSASFGYTSPLLAETLDVPMYPLRNVENDLLLTPPDPTLLSSVHSTVRKYTEHTSAVRFSERPQCDLPRTADDTANRGRSPSLDDDELMDLLAQLNNAPSVSPSCSPTTFTHLGGLRNCTPSGDGVFNTSVSWEHLDVADFEAGVPGTMNAWDVSNSKTIQSDNVTGMDRISRDTAKPKTLPMPLMGQPAQERPATSPLFQQKQQGFYNPSTCQYITPSGAPLSVPLDAPNHSVNGLAAPQGGAPSMGVYMLQNPIYTTGQVPSHAPGVQTVLMAMPDGRVGMLPVVYAQPSVVTGGAQLSGQPSYLPAGLQLVYLPANTHAHAGSLTPP